MREALAMLHRQVPTLEVDGEMHGDAALSEVIRMGIMAHTRLQGRANLLVMPNLDAANICFNLLKALGDNVTVGPILLGVAKSAHILTPTATVRRIVNMTALAVMDANARAS
jgi:malate dehydrogenase (oxaloacetate-decarboxylating)(NADP+)